MKPALAEALQFGAAQLEAGSDLLSPEQIEAGRERLLFAIENVKSDYIVNWHHEQLAEALEKVQSGEIRNLMVFMPPRHGKSELVSRHFPAWCLGKNPDEKIMACSYSASLAMDMGIDVQNIMHTEEYQAMFSTRLKSGVEAKKGARKVRETNLRFDIVNANGYYIGAGIDGGLTGRGWSLGIIDDYCKNRLQAESKTWRNRIWREYVAAFITRGEGGLSAGGCERKVICATPWREDDLSGMVLANAVETGEQWVIIRFPAIKDDEDAGVYTSSPEFHDPRELGEPLWPVRKTVKDLAIIRGSGSMDWTSLWCCRPAAAEGNMFKREWWQYYDELPKSHLIWAFSLDCNFDKGEDTSFVVLGLWATSGPDEYLTDVWRGRLDYSETKALCRSKFAAHPKAHTKRIEKKANGAAIINELKVEFPGLVPIEPKGSKEARGLSIQGRVEAGNVHLPRHAAWVPEFIDELAAFPNGANDDQADMMTQHLEYSKSSSHSFLRAITAGMK